ncbi:MAG: hypothetical protein AAF360_11380 [Pseudomonadota bacterium]
MAQPFQITGVPTKAKAEEIARTMRILFPDWKVEIIGGAPPYIVRRTPPAAAPAAAVARGAPAPAPPANPDEPAAPPPADAADTVATVVTATERDGAPGFLDFIANYESRGNYNARFGAAANQTDPEFVSMTIDEVLDWQLGRKFSACGKFQIIRATLLSLKSQMGLTGAETYDEAMQEKMGERLLVGRGLTAFLAGDMNRDLFALNVAREWAALPRVVPPDASKSVYAGDGVNHALVTVADYVAAIDRLKSSA